MREWPNIAGRDWFKEALQQIASAQQEPFPGDELANDLAWLREVDVDDIFSTGFDSKR